MSEQNSTPAPHEPSVPAPLDSTGAAPSANPPPDETAAPVPGDRYAHRRAEPRPLAALWIAYLASVGLLCLGSVGFSGLMSQDIYRPVARVGLLLAGLGVGVLWPMIRLSQEFPLAPRRSALADLSVILPPLHAFIWPQMFGWMAAWPPRVVTVIALTLTAWGVVIGALLSLCMAKGREIELGGKIAPRSRWMLGFLALNMAGPLVALWRLPNDSSSSLALLLSPASASMELGADRSWTGTSAATLPEHWWALWGVAGAGVALWLAGASVARRREVA